jgi:hypothetical protein
MGRLPGSWLSLLLPTPGSRSTGSHNDPLGDKGAGSAEPGRRIGNPEAAARGSSRH